MSPRKRKTYPVFNLRPEDHEIIRLLAEKDGSSLVGAVRKAIELTHASTEKSLGRKLTLLKSELPLE